MRIKSYFDSSIQTAMRQARYEFGDDVILVSSRIASPESRHLGDFEVVCSADEPQTAPKEVDTAAAKGFEQLFRRQLAPAGLRVDAARGAGIAVIRSSLIDIGLEPALTEALIALIRACAPPHSADGSRFVWGDPAVASLEP